MSEGFIPPEARVCGVCGRMLDFWEAEGWMHSIATLDPGEVDHPPIPVSVEDAGEQFRPRCDFCYGDYPPFVLPVRDFVRGVSHSGGGWAACENCAPLIEKNMWGRLAIRSFTGYKARHGTDNTAEDDAAQLTQIKGMHRQVRKNITGALRPV